MPALIGSIAGKALSLLESIGKVVFYVFLISVLLAFLSGFLPSDPFRSLIDEFITYISPYYTLLNLIVPIPLVCNLLLFRGAWYIYTFVPTLIYRYWSPHGRVFKDYDI